MSAIHVKEAPLGDALRAALRSCNLDYRVVGNMVYVSSPEKLRSEPLEPLVTRIYSPRAMGQGDPLPKVVVMNTAGPQGMAGTVTPRVPGQTPGSTPRR
ncbi:MAG: hypothetical protein GY851_18230 [bacterium]|nr:hypothetical protein [bacterium]